MTPEQQQDLLPKVSHHIFLKDRLVGAVMAPAKGNPNGLHEAHVLNPEAVPHRMDHVGFFKTPEAASGFAIKRLTQMAKTAEANVEAEKEAAKQPAMTGPDGKPKPKPPTPSKPVVTPSILEDGLRSDPAQYICETLDF